MIVFRLDASSGLPPFLQLVRQVRHALRLGLLEVGDQLPTVREVAGELAINPNTVLKAYRDLEREGLVEARPGLGTFVRTRPAGPAPGAYLPLRQALRRWLREARRAGLDDESIVELVAGSMREASDEAVA